MPIAKKKVIAELGSTRYSNVLSAKLAQSAFHGKPWENAMFVLSNKHAWGARTSDTYRHFAQIAGSPTREMRADFRKIPFAPESIDELHANFVLSERETVAVPDRRTQTKLYKQRMVKSDNGNRVVKRHVDARHFRDFSGIEKIMEQARVVLKKRGKLVIVESEVFVPSRELERIAQANGLRKLRISRDIEEIKLHSLEAGGVEGKYPKTTYLIELEKA